jgi:hypothetical protein
VPANGACVEAPYPEVRPLAPWPQPADVPDTLGGYQILKDLGTVKLPRLPR